MEYIVLILMMFSFGYVAGKVKEAGHIKNEIEVASWSEDIVIEVGKKSYSVKRVD